MLGKGMFWKRSVPCGSLDSEMAFCVCKSGDTLSCWTASGEFLSNITMSNSTTQRTCQSESRSSTVAALSHFLPIVWSRDRELPYGGVRHTSLVIHSVPRASDNQSAGNTRSVKPPLRHATALQAAGSETERQATFATQHRMGAKALPALLLSKQALQLDWKRQHRHLKIPPLKRNSAPRLALLLAALTCTAAKKLQHRQGDAARARKRVQNRERIRRRTRRHDDPVA